MELGCTCGCEDGGVGFTLPPFVEPVEAAGPAGWVDEDEEDGTEVEVEEEEEEEGVGGGIGGLVGVFGETVT